VVGLDPLGPGRRRPVERVDVAPALVLVGVALGELGRLPLHRVVHAPGIHLRPDAGGGLLLGAEDIDSLAANAGPPAALDEAAALLLERAARVFPSARRVKVIDTRLGVRPMPADHHTIAGRIPGFANAWMIATHSGVTLGPLLGRLLADEIVRGVASSTLVPFRPERFATVGEAAG